MPANATTDAQPLEALNVLGAGRREIEATLSRLRERLLADPPKTSGVEWVEGFRVRVNDAPNFYMLFKDVFCHRIYDFETTGDQPVILDCGANIGMGILFFKCRWPKARITAFEPDRAVLPYLRENLDCNGLADVSVVEAALAATSRKRRFLGDGKYGGHLSDSDKGMHRLGHAAAIVRPDANDTYEVECVRLRDHLDGPVDFLKMNIEGAEWDVLHDCDGRLKCVSAMAIEYHHLPGHPRRLHRILELLEDNGFDSVVHSYDAETNPHGQPPFRIHKNTTYYALVAAARRDGA